jgi:prophage regulatory protein
MIDASASAASLQVIRLPQVLRMTGLCRSTIYQLEAEEKFPKRVQLAPRAVG